jgi:hypothetical protein
MIVQKDDKFYVEVSSDTLMSNELKNIREFCIPLKKTHDWVSEFYAGKRVFVFTDESQAFKFWTLFGKDRL